ncbi:XRE family transcriptional regulator [Campylobacter canadensis]|uniref:XRE family transcriptional regulator n=1 Tax=Campylobacter canadensis TaxID=449520 RepID=A0ABS7WQN9_9BACT|nr:XRE family transcriptional regulator [Campylobacter canadensis]MBZ7986833.1 XRE family transcriptional regulator [Campylobacter canadensis]MBZ7994154.1 XRE family transcriptional regulator [Campylobacter canadensis]MBZ7995853.1 XRE family transcriptional regulator [Campylobacter canadensis]MBZ7997870.1 XRE family transcriptional regulator [Campylobacter canadensis]MBZ7999486.1 XRE family transcriptional regulator [Campylobacter canadensis]
MLETNDIFNLLHNAIESKENGKKISLQKMSQRLDVPMRTYQDWRLGNSKPQAVMAVFTMLCELDDDELLFLMSKIKKQLKDKN